MEQDIDKELQKAAVQAFKDIVDSGKNSFLEIFKAGAQWQKQQMLSKAVDARCFGYQSGEALFSFKLPAEEYLVGSVVKVIIKQE